MRETNIRELDFLSQSIQDMDRRLEDSTHRMLTLKEYESRGKRQRRVGENWTI